MPEKILKVNISTPEKTIYEGETSSLIAPGELGYLGVLVDHAPLIANLGPGNIIIKGLDDRQLTFRNKGAGILEVLKNSVSVLVDDAEQA